MRLLYSLKQRPFHFYRGRTATVNQRNSYQRHARPFAMRIERLSSMVLNDSEKLFLPKFPFERVSKGIIWWTLHQGFSRAKSRPFGVRPEPYYEAPLALAYRGCHDSHFWFRQSWKDFRIHIAQGSGIWENESGCWRFHLPVFRIEPGFPLLVLVAFLLWSMKQSALVHPIDLPYDLASPSGRLRVEEWPT